MIVLSLAPLAVWAMHDLDLRTRRAGSVRTVIQALASARHYPERRNEMDIRPKPDLAAYMLLSVLIAGAIWGTIGPPKPCRERPIGTPRMSKVGMCGSIARAR